MGREKARRVTDALEKFGKDAKSGLGKIIKNELVKKFIRMRAKKLFLKSSLGINEIIGLFSCRDCNYFAKQKGKEWRSVPFHS